MPYFTKKLVIPREEYDANPIFPGFLGIYRVIEIKLRSLALNTLYHKHYEVQLTSHGTQIRAIFSKVSCT